jgi:chromate reductase
MTKRIAVLVGSLRKESINRKLAKFLILLAPNTIKAELVEIGDLPMYNQDLDEGDGIPEAWNKFRHEMKTYQAVLFVTPEFNRSVPGALKNAIDVGSRPYGQSIWSGKPGAVISASPGAVGGFGANHHLRQSLVFLDIPTLQQPEAYLGHAGNLFDTEGKITNEDTLKFLEKFMEAFINWVEKNTIVNSSTMPP